jgi:transcription-repair coupling factor (superfamily II helicase)
MTKAQHITVGGAPEGFDATLILAEVAKTGAPVLHVARDDKRMAAMQAALRFFAPDMPVITFPGWDCLPYDRV